jgi:hypothetical protein
MASEKKPKTITIDAEITDLGSALNVSDIAYSKETYTGN